MNRNPKVRWVVIEGAPDLSNDYWDGRSPTPTQLKEQWLNGVIYDTKGEAETAATEYRRHNHYLVYVEKHNPRKHQCVST